MKVISFNANGIRAAFRKNFLAWFLEQNADVLCIQETKAQHAQLTDEIKNISGYQSTYLDAQKKGYSGVAIYTRLPIQRIYVEEQIALLNDEGRFLVVELEDVIIASLYLPSGSSSEERQAIKMRLLSEFTPVLTGYLKAEKPFIICGDFNIVHKEIDIKNWKSNQKNSGCLPEERAWLDLLLDEIGWVDAFRVVNQAPDQYTWWSNRGRARENNVGWRIDYQMISPDLQSKVLTSEIYKKSWFSDHAPLIMEYDLR